MSKLYINEQYITDISYVAERLMSTNSGAHHYLIIRKENVPSDFFSNFPIEFLNEDSINLIEIKDENDVVTFSTTSFTSLQDCDIIREDASNENLNINQVLFRFVKADANKQFT